MLAFACLFHHPCNDLLSTVALYALRHWHRFKSAEVASLLWALALLKACPPDTWRLLLDKLAVLPASAFDTADLLQLYQTYLLLDSATAACAPWPEKHPSLGRQVPAAFAFRRTAMSWCFTCLLHELCYRRHLACCSHAAGPLCTLLGRATPGLQCWHCVRAIS